MEIFSDKRIDDLEFNNLKIIQNKKNFCFGIDSVLISNFCAQNKIAGNAVDIGSGTGIISILIATKAKINHIYAIEIQNEIAEMSKRSIKLNHLENKIEVLNINLKNSLEYITPNSIDCVVTNPPYMKNGSGAKNDEPGKIIARHEVKATLSDILDVSYKLLKDRGEFYIVHRMDRLVDVLSECRMKKLEPKVIQFIHPYVNKSPNLFMIKAIKNGGKQLKVLDPLVIYNDNGEYTDEILKIYGKK